MSLMETPSPDAGVPSEAAPTSDNPLEPGDRAVLLFLGRGLLPGLRNRATRAVQDAVRQAISDHRLAPLERLGARHRQELLLALEQVSGGRRRPSAAVLVRLTTVISATPRAAEPIGVAASRPAR